MLRSDRNPAGAAMEKEEPAQEERIVPVVEEELVADRRPVKTGSVRLEKHVEKSRKRVEAPLIREEVEVRHVPVNRVITAMPETRREGETIIVPVVEEELVITKRMVLKEEIHLIKRRTSETTVRHVELNRERAVLERTDADGRIIEESGAETPPAPARSSRLRR